MDNNEFEEEKKREIPRVLDSVEVKKEKPKKKQNNNNGIGIVLLVSILLSFVCGMIGAYLISQTVSVEQVVKNITTSELVENSISSSVDKVYDSTVAISHTLNGKLITGTGFIYKKKNGLAYIITNNHVIDGAEISMRILRYLLFLIKMNIKL